VLVDEFQDVNTPQYALLKLLALPQAPQVGAGSWREGATAGLHVCHSAADSPAMHCTARPLPPTARPQASLFAVGDPDQAIYDWRGADMRHMTQSLEADFPNVQVGWGRIRGTPPCNTRTCTVCAEQQHCVC
jgi:superfamily I DNA/RNA helicase